MGIEHKPDLMLNTILAVDDDHGVTVLWNMLSQEGVFQRRCPHSGAVIEPYTLEIHNLPEEAVKSFDPRKHAAVMTDRSMPVMDGDEVARRIKTCSRQTPVVMISGMTPSSDELSAMEIDLFCEKPTSLNDISAISESIHPLSELLRGKTEAEEAVIAALGGTKVRYIKRAG